MTRSFQKNLDKLMDDVNPTILHSKLFLKYQPSLKAGEKLPSALPQP